MSENLQRRIDEAVKQLSTQAYEVAVQQIRDNREAIDKIVEVLMEKETISGDEFRTMLSQYTTIPEENLKVRMRAEGGGTAGALCVVMR